MQSAPAADTMAALSEQCTRAMDMAGAASEDSPPEDAAVSVEALEASAAVDSGAAALPEVSKKEIL